MKTASITAKKLKIQALVWSQLNVFRYPRFVLLAGTIVTFTGLANTIGGLAKTQLLDIPDPIFGLPLHYLMLFFGAGQLLCAFFCLFTNKQTLGLGLAVWLSADFIVYRIGLGTMGWHHSCGFLVAQLGLSLPATDAILSLSSAFVLVGGVAVLCIERKTTLAAGLFKMACPSCGARIRFAVRNLGQQIPCPHCKTAIVLRKAEDNLKMTCVLCNGHVEFPAHALGQKISCPHCSKTITLLKPV